MDLYNMDFVRVNSYSMMFRSDKREFPHFKLGVITTVALIIVALIPWIIYGNDLHAYTGAFDDRVYDHQGASLLNALGLFCAGISLVVTGCYWFVVRPNWKPRRIIEEVHLDFRPPLMQKHIWHPVYVRALTDLYHATRKGRIPYQEWITVFTELNKEMEPLTARREEIENPKPDIENYLFQIKSEKEILERIS